MVRVWFFDVILGLVVLLVEQIAKVFGGEGDDVGWILLDDGLRVVLQDVGQLLGDHDLLGAVDALLANVRH
jgi:hypothetical protein